jgi:hypothetical protein
MELFKNKININPIDFINWYIINKFSIDFDINPNVNKTNKYIMFIRFYARFLDSKKNELLEKFGLDPSLSYQDNFDDDFLVKLNKSINEELNYLVIK